MKGKKHIIITVMIATILLGYFTYSNFFNVKLVDKYLADNYKTANLNEEGISNTLKLIDDSREYDIFFTGESHGMLGNEKISLEMLKYLNQKEDVRYLICELQYSVVSKLNQYIQNGDEEMLKEAIEVIRNQSFSMKIPVKFLFLL